MREAIFTPRENLTHLDLDRIIQQGKELQKKFPSSGWCGRCKWPWAAIEEHATPYAPGRMLFPLCETCWAQLTPEQRLPYYRGLYNCWTTNSGILDEKFDFSETLLVPVDDTWLSIEQNVMAGL
jgi:hypothetical protein